MTLFGGSFYILKNNLIDKLYLRCRHNVVQYSGQLIVVTKSRLTCSL